MRYSAARTSMQTAILVMREARLSSNIENDDLEYIDILRCCERQRMRAWASSPAQGAFKEPPTTLRPKSGWPCMATRRGVKADPNLQTGGCWRQAREQYWGFKVHPQPLYIRTLHDAAPALFNRPSHDA